MDTLFQNNVIKYIKIKKDVRAETKEKIQELLMTLRKSGDYELDATLYDLIRLVGGL